MRSFVRRSSFAFRASALTAVAGLAASAHAALFTFIPVCSSPSWTGFCNTAAPCGGGNFITNNNWGNTACGVSPALPPSGSDIVIAGNGTLDAGTGMASIVINPGVIAVQAASINTSGGYTNNGTISTSGGDKTFSGMIASNGVWSEDGAGWTRGFNTASFTNAGTLQFPGSVVYAQSTGVNSLNNASGATMIKNGGGTANVNSFAVNNSGNITSNAGGAMTFNSVTFTSNSGASYNASAGGTINFVNCNVNGAFPMMLGANNLMSFSTFTCGSPVTFNATGGAVLLSGNMTASAVNTLTNDGLVQVGGGDQGRAGLFVNAPSGVWTDDSSGWTRTLNTHTFNNMGTLNFPGTVVWAQSTGANSLNNSGTIVKSAGGTAWMNSFPRSNTGTMNVVANGGTLAFNGSSFSSTGGASYSVMGPNSALQWNGTTISGNFPISLSAGGGASFNTTTTNSPMTVNATGGAVGFSGNLNTSGGVLTNTGQMAFSSGDVSWTGGWTNAGSGVITEDASGWSRALNTTSITNNGTLNLPGSVNWNQSTGTNTVLNTGIINKTGGGQFVANNIASFTNNGTIAVASGGGNMLLSSLSYSGSGSATVAAGGGIQLNACTITGPINAANSGGTYQSTGALTVPAAGAQLNVTGSGFAVNGNLAINTTSGLLRNNNIVTVGGGDKTITGDVTNSVGATWTEDGSGWSRALNSHDFTNQGTLNLPGSVNWNQSTGSNTLTNTGTINKASGGQFHANNINAVTNDGVINVPLNGGNFLMTSLAYSGTGTGTIASGGGVQLNNCTITGPINGVNTGGTFQSTGSLTTGTGGASLNVTGSGFLLNGNKAGSPLLTNNNIVTVSGGDKTISGAITNAPGATWTENGSGWSRAFNSSVFTNNGTLNLPGGVAWNQSTGINSLTNNAGGVVNKTAGGTFTTDIGGGVINAGLIDIASGTFTVNSSMTQSASTGRILVRSGAGLSGSAFTMANGRLEGRGTVSQSMTNSGGTVAPGDSASANGALTFNNQYTQQAGGIYEVSLFGRPASPYDRIVSTNQMTLAGTLRVVITPPFLPKLNDVYEVARSNSGQRTGTFSGVVVDGPAAVTVNVTYTASSVFLTITGTECGSIDFNNDTSFFDPQDIDAFLSVFSEGDCIPSTATCNDIDFNNDASVFDPCDIDSFLTVFAEGPCTLCGQ